ncbi:hypothetical protein MKW92_035007 [Papaver armeniacum]|nr:hypothetical protein MKW92_035007 [Papaver armeniacum]
MAGTNTVDFQNYLPTMADKLGGEGLLENYTTVRNMLREGYLDDGALNQMKFCVLRFSPDLLESCYITNRTVSLDSSLKCDRLNFSAH